MRLFTERQGETWSFCLETQGLPWVHSDGVASWAGLFPAHEDIPGTLATREFVLRHLSDPQDPLQTGQGVTFDLVDDGTQFVFRTWAKDFKGTRFGTLRTSLGAGSGDTTINVYYGPGSSSSIPNDAYLFVGKETLRVTGTPAAGQHTVQRARLDTMRDEHRVFDSIRPTFSTSPTVFNDRVTTLWACPVDVITGLLDVSEARPIWAGVIQEVRMSEEKVAILCEPLSQLLKDAWPVALPSGTLNRGGSGNADLEFTMLEQEYLLSISYLLQDNQGFGNMVSRSVWLEMGYYDDTGTWTPLVPGTGLVRLSEYIKWVQDTIIHWNNTDSNAPLYSSAPIAASQFSLGLRVEDNTLYIVSSAQTLIWVGGFQVHPARGLLPNWAGARQHRGRWDIPLNTRDRKVGAYNRNTLYYLSSTATEIDLKLDRPAYPFTLTNPWFSSDANDIGFAVIGTGENHEVIAFTGVTMVDTRHCRLTGVKRGAGQTMPRDWGAKVKEDGTVEIEEGDVTIQQMMVVTNHEGWNGYADQVEFYRVILAVLTSTASRGQNGTHDVITGYRMGRALPTRWVDLDSFARAQATYSLPRVQAFWVLESDKGKEAVQEFMKLAGAYLVEKKFQDAAGIWRFGISLETLDLPLTTNYAGSLTDAEHHSGTKVVTNFNDRMVINNTRIKPQITWGSKEGRGDEIFNWCEWSIAEHGNAKALEFKPSVLFTRFDRYGRTDTDRAATVAWVTECSWRWFSSFGRGMYTLTVDTVPPIGMRYNIGEQVLISLTGARGPKGDSGIDAVGQIISIENHLGSRAHTKIKLRLSFEQFAEIAPSMRATVSTGTLLTVASGNLSRYSNLSQFVPGTSQAQARDWNWFAFAAAGGTLPCRIWPRGNWAGGLDVVLTHTSGPNFSSSVSMASFVGQVVEVSFRNWNLMSARAKQYAFISTLLSTVFTKEYA
jgi:hypothetical protein